MNGFLVCLGGVVVVVVVVVVADDVGVDELVATVAECFFACFLASALVLTVKDRMPRLRAWHACLDGARSNDAMNARIDLQSRCQWRVVELKCPLFLSSDRNWQSDASDQACASSDLAKRALKGTLIVLVSSPYKKKKLQRLCSIVRSLHFHFQLWHFREYSNEDGAIATKDPPPSSLIHLSLLLHPNATSILFYIIS